MPAFLFVSPPLPLAGEVAHSAGEGSHLSRLRERSHAVRVRVAQLTDVPAVASFNQYVIAACHVEWPGMRSLPRDDVELVGMGDKCSGAWAPVAHDPDCGGCRSG